MVPYFCLMSPAKWTGTFLMARTIASTAAWGLAACFFGNAASYLAVVTSLVLIGTLGWDLTT